VTDKATSQEILTLNAPEMWVIVQQLVEASADWKHRRGSVVPVSVPRATLEAADVYDQMKGGG